MGLDVMVYTGPLTKAEEMPARGSDRFYDLVYEREMLVPSNYNGFGRLGSLEDGVPYETQGRTSFRAGSYSGYSEYRSCLCEMALGVTPDKVWADRDKYKGRPFYEQIDFADNEDTLGPEVCAKLAEDYDANAEAAVAFAAKLPGDQRDWFTAKYETWRLAFRVAADSKGAIDYA